MKLNNVFNEFSSKYSYNFFAYSIFFTLFEYLVFIFTYILFTSFILKNPLTSLFTNGGPIIIVFVFGLSLPTMFFYLLISKLIIFTELIIKENRNIHFRIKPKIFTNNTLYKLFLLLLCITNCIFIFYIVKFSIEAFINQHEAIIQTQSYSLLLFILFFIIYFHITKLKKSIYTKIIIYILFYVVISLYTVSCFLHP